MHLFMISLGGFEQTTLNFSAIQKYDFLHQYYQALGQLLTDIDGQIQRVIAETVVVCLPDEYTETSSLMWLVVILQEWANQKIPGIKVEIRLLPREYTLFLGIPD